MNMMNYGGYAERIKLDEKDNYFVGRVLGLRSIINLHVEAGARLRREFGTAVKGCLHDCGQQGVAPERAVSEGLLLRGSAEIRSVPSLRFRPRASA